MYDLCRLQRNPNTKAQLGRYLSFNSANSGEHEALILLNALVEEGVIKLAIDRYYPLAQVAGAHRYFEEGQRMGNAGIAIDHD